jgi:heptosyltransferase-2
MGLRKVLIVNTGALGAVVRATVLLNEFLDQEVYWLTSEKTKDFMNSKKIKKLFFIENEEDKISLKSEKFDLVISLDEEKDSLDVIYGINYKKIIGVYYNKEGIIDYSHDSSYWFDMSLSSKFGKIEADRLKVENKKSVPQIYIEMVGGVWSGQEYDIGITNPSQIKKLRIGLIDENTGAWPNKNWKYWDELKRELEGLGYEVIYLGKRDSLKEHIDDIGSCEFVICPDTFGMHIALAMKKKIITIFNCTDPDEIYDYGRMKKIVSPLLRKYYYKKSFDEEAISAIKVENVIKALEDF